MLAAASTDEERPSRALVAEDAVIGDEEGMAEVCAGEVAAAVTDVSDFGGGMALTLLG